MKGARSRGSCLHRSTLAPLVLLALVPATARAGGGGGGDGRAGEGSASSPEQEPTEFEDLEDALRGGHTWLNFRYRYEFVDQDGFSGNANANTVRTVLGYRTGVWQGFAFSIEFEDVKPLFGQRYNSTTNGKSNLPVVADPDITEVNQAFLDYVGFEGTTFRGGRQEINLDNERFVGNVGWRQNHQSFDALSFTSKAIPDLSFFYAYVNNVNRIFGDGSPMGNIVTDTHLLNVAYEIEGVGKAIGYFYGLDNEDAPNLSSNTVGVRFAGQADVGEDLDLLYTAEYAAQTDTGDNPNEVDQDYYLAELGGRVGAVTVRGALEHLGGSGDPGDAFQTPLATGHKFNGYADVFLTTPDDGLDDYYLVAAAKLADVDCYTAYHVFQSDSNGIDYGTEIDLNLVYPITESLSVGLQAAFFDADQAFQDVTKVIFSLSYAAF